MGVVLIVVAVLLRGDAAVRQQDDTCVLIRSAVVLQKIDRAEQRRAERRIGTALRGRVRHLLLEGVLVLDRRRLHHIRHQIDLFQVERVVDGHIL